MHIPVSELESLAQRQDLSHVIVLAHDNDGQTDHVATYGHSVRHSFEAAEFGNKLKDAMGWPQSLHAYSPRVQQLFEAIVALYNALEFRERCPSCGGHGLQWVMVDPEGDVDAEPCECSEIALYCLEHYRQQYDVAVDEYLRAQGHDPETIAKRFEDLAAMLFADVR